MRTSIGHASTTSPAASDASKYNFQARPKRPQENGVSVYKASSRVNTEPILSNTSVIVISCSHTSMAPAHRPALISSANFSASASNFTLVMSTSNACDPQHTNCSQKMTRGQQGKGRGVDNPQVLESSNFAGRCDDCIRILVFPHFACNEELAFHFHSRR
jgi:hypothetical protein